MNEEEQVKEIRNTISKEKIGHIFRIIAYQLTIIEFRTVGSARSFNIEEDIMIFISTGKIPEYMKLFQHQS